MSPAVYPNGRKDVKELIAEMREELRLEEAQQKKKERVRRRLAKKQAALHSTSNSLKATKLARGRHSKSTVRLVKADTFANALPLKKKLKKFLKQKKVVKDWVENDII